MNSPGHHLSDSVTPPSADTVILPAGERRLLSKAQVAGRLGCSERSVERLVQQGRFPAPRRYGRSVVWFEAAVEHVLALAEREQLQWQPAPIEAPGMAQANAGVIVSPPGSPIPDAHELEPDTCARLPRRPRTGAGSMKRRVAEGASAADIEALSRAFAMRAA